MMANKYMKLFLERHPDYYKLDNIRRRAYKNAWQRRKRSKAQIEGQNKWIQENREICNEVHKVQKDRSDYWVKRRLFTLIHMGVIIPEVSED